MSNENPTANESSGKTEVEQLKNELAAEREQRKSVEQELQSLKEDYGNYRQAMSKKLNSLKNQLEEVRGKQSSDANGGGSAEEDGSENSDILPIERLAKMKEQDSEHPALPSNGKESFDRALSIFEHFSKWSKKTPKGYTITSGLKNLLEAVTGEKLAWRQCYRAMDTLEKFTDGLIQHKTTSRHGHVLVAKERLSSVGG